MSISENDTVLGAHKGDTQMGDRIQHGVEAGFPRITLDEDTAPYLEGYMVRDSETVEGVIELAHGGRYALLRDRDVPRYPWKLVRGTVVVLPGVETTPRITAELERVRSAR